MPTFTYTARDQSGSITSGTVDAESNSRAVATLRAQGLWVTEIKAGSGRPAASSGIPAGDRYGAEQSTFKSMFSPVSKKDLSLFYRQLHTLLNSGSALYGALEMLGRTNQTPNRHLRRAIVQLGQDVLQGRTLSQAMTRFPWLFDRLQVRMIEAGEHGGLLVDILRRISDYLQQEFEFGLEIKRKTLYPKLLLAALLLIPPLPTLVLVGPGAYVSQVWGTIVWFVLLGIPIFLAFRFLLTTQGGRNFYDQVKLSIPVIGTLVRKLTMARFSRTLAALYGAGVPLMSATQLAAETSGNNVLEVRVLRNLPAVERGTPLSVALDATHFFPPIFIGMVQTGETSGSLDEILNKGAEFYEEEALHATIQLTTILGVVLLLIMALLIAIKIISAYTGMYGGMMNPGGPGDTSGE